MERRPPPAPGDPATYPGPPVVVVRLPRWKRVEDLALGGPLFLLSLPILAAIGLAVRLIDGPPVFYRDVRVGAGGASFRVLKFRTMVPDAEHQSLGRLVARNDARITRTGTILRRFSLDELPQLWNVVAGDMSLVGPRPTFPEQVRRYVPAHLRRLRVRPGLTGLAQVNGRNDLSWSRRIEYDLEYIERMTPLLDLGLILRTPLMVLRGIGLYGRSGVTPDYDGDQSIK